MDTRKQVKIRISEKNRIGSYYEAQGSGSFIGSGFGYGTQSGDGFSRDQAGWIFRRYFGDPECERGMYMFRGDGPRKK